MEQIKNDQVENANEAAKSIKDWFEQTYKGDNGNTKENNEVAKNLAEKIKQQRKKLKISQQELAQKSGVSLGSIKRFETKYEISLQSFIKITIALDLDSDFESLFTTKTYTSIDEVING